MKRNKDTIIELIKYAKEKWVRLNLLDFYWTEEKSDVWNDEFIPVESIFDQLENEFWAPDKFEKFWCNFVTFNDWDIAVVRTKSSFWWTMRAPKCETCTEYCQEWIFCLRLSSQWWITTCPSKSESKWVLIKPEHSIEDIIKLTSSLVWDIESSVLDEKSFKKLEEKRGLSPKTEEAKDMFELL
jgi:molybdenum cofactor biosynthesis enzyme MoaA